MEVVKGPLNTEARKKSIINEHRPTVTTRTIVICYKRNKRLALRARQGSMMM